MKNYEPDQESFEKDVANWKMETLLDNGLYRHLRFRMSNGGFRWFDIITWPGHLVITGDCETYTFTRVEDMFKFFPGGGDKINPGYWQEKICDGRDRAEGFDEEAFRKEVCRRRVRLIRSLRERGCPKDDRRDIWEEIQSDIVDMIRGQHEAVSYASVHEFSAAWRDESNTRHSACIDIDEWPDCKGYDFHYIWCCRAIVWAIGKYDAAKAQATTQQAGVEHA